MTTHAINALRPVEELRDLIEEFPIQCAVMPLHHVAALWNLSPGAVELAERLERLDYFAEAA